MDLDLLANSTTGDLVRISGTDPRHGEWQHQAFVPHPLPADQPELSAATHLSIGNARAALAALDSTASRLPNPQLLRSPTLRREAQSTSALEGTYEPLADVLLADQEAPTSSSMREVLNFVAAAEHAFDSVADGRPLSVGLLTELQQILVSGTPGDGRQAGRVREIQVVIGQRGGAPASDVPVHRARFIPPPPGPDLDARVRDLVSWVRHDHRGRIDPVAAAAMAHYQFEALHPFHDGNGRIGRLLVVVQFCLSGTLSEPTMLISPWFEARRQDYYDRLFDVSSAGDWDHWIGFFAQGIEASAVDTRTKMLGLLDAQEALHDLVNQSPLRADTAHRLVDIAVGRTVFTVRDIEHELSISYNRANRLVGDLVDLNVLAGPIGTYGRLFFAPAVLARLSA